MIKLNCRADGLRGTNGGLFMILEKLTVGFFGTNCYLVGCARTREALVLDPGAEGSRIAEKIEELDLRIKAVVNTHGHIDHILANSRIKSLSRAPLMLHREDLNLYSKPGFLLSFLTRKLPAPEEHLEEGDSITAGELQFKVIHTPGHTPGGVCLYREGHLFTGDTLFAGGVGRTDMRGGSMKQLLQSIKDKLLPLPESTTIYPGHGPSSTLGEEIRNNPFLSGV